MSTQSYYKDRLGFDPNESLNGELDKTQQGYEENLSKFKGIPTHSIRTVCVPYKKCNPYEPTFSKTHGYTFFLKILVPKISLQYVDHYFKFWK